MLYYLGYPLSYSINGFPDFGSVGEMKKEVKKKNLTTTLRIGASLM